MSNPGFRFVPFVCLLVSGCQPDSAAEWGPARTVPQTQRPTEWGAPTKSRLELQDMQAPQGQQGQQAGGKRFVAKDPPAVWEAQPPQPEKFKDLVWRITSDAKTECYLTAQVGGGVAGNLSRWYGQFGVTEVPAVESLPVIELGGRPGRLVELAGTYRGTAGQAMLLAFTSQGDSVTTLKFTGSEATVKAHRDSFVALAKSLRSASPSPDPKAPPIAPGQPLPDGHPPVPGVGTSPSPQAPNPATPTPPAASPFVGKPPAGWSPKTGTSRPLHHTFGTEGEVYVSQLGGGLRGSVDIWRSEMGLPAATDEEFAGMPKVPMLGGDAVLLDLSGDMKGMTKQLPGARLLVAAQQSGGTITFCKLVGKAADVEAQRAGFLEFCATLGRSQ